MSKLTIFLLMVLMSTACGDDHSSKPPAQDLQPPPVAHPINPPQILDSTPPDVISFRQEGLERLVVEFSEPIQRIDTIGYDAGIETPSWDASRRILTAVFHQDKVMKGKAPVLRLAGIVDDANLRNPKELVIPIDVRGPLLRGIEIVDTQNLRLTFNEDVRISDGSTVTVNAKFTGTVSASPSSARQLIVKVPLANLARGDSHQLVVTKIADQYGNIADIRRGFAQGEDLSAPTILSIKQLPTTRVHPETFLVFELEFSEYVIDKGDFDASNNISFLHINPAPWLKINGKVLIGTEGQWLPRDDHLGGTLRISSYFHGNKFLNDSENTLEMQLSDASGNSQWAKGSLLVDSAAPSLTGDFSQSTQCEMTGMKSFRCGISEADVKAAVLAPEGMWPADAYTFKVTTEDHDGAKQHWLNFAFKQDIPERPIVEIMTVDFLGNTSLDRDLHSFFFKPSTTPAELMKATAFSSSMIELEFTKDVGAIDKVLIDGVEMPFAMTFVDNALDPSAPSCAVIHFKNSVPAGIHSVELIGIRRARNSFVRTERAELKDLDNRIPSILQSSITQEPDLKRTQDFRFELTQAFAGDLSAFVHLAGSDHTINKTPFTDFTLTPEGMTPRGTYSFRLHKETAVGLQPNSFDQGIMLQLPGQPLTKPISVGWSTREPALRIKEIGRADGFEVFTHTAVDLDSLDLEITNESERIAIHRSWISPYEKSSEDFGFSVKLPESIRLKKGFHTYKVRVKAARTKNFGIALSKAYELHLTVK
jgi:hypothetical protein